MPVYCRGVCLNDDFTEPTGTEPPSLPFLPPGLGQDDERGHEFQAYKAAFFFKLDRELEKAGHQLTLPPLLTLTFTSTRLMPSISRKRRSSSRA